MAGTLPRLVGGAVLAAVIAASPGALPLVAQQNPPRAAAPDAAAAAILRSYQPVTDARLLTPEDAGWLMIRRTYDGWGYSPLDQITTGNVARLKQVWTMPTGVDRVHEAAPIVNGRVMFVSTPANQVLALEAATGKVLWRYVRPRPRNVFVLHDTNRGVALLGDKVYYAAAEAVLVALDAKTGKEVWTTRLPAGATGAPTNANANPMSYQGKNGKQYVAVIASPNLVVYALP
jgi:alcohol dehydrogenase (cytochrome c)